MNRQSCYRYTKLMNYLFGSALMLFLLGLRRRASVAIR